MNHKQLTQSDFAWCKWKVSDINSFAEKANKSIKAKYEAIKKIKKEDKTFLNTVSAYEIANDSESIEFHQISTLAMTSDKKEIREAARLCQVNFSHFAVDLAYDIELYRSIKEYFDFNYKKEKKNLDEQDIRLIKDIILGFKRMGFDLPEKERQKLKDIDKKISKLESEYDERLNEDTSFILCDEKEINGIPEMIKSSFQKIDDKYKVSLQYPEYGPFIKYATDRNKRKELYLLFNNVGEQRNVSILKELIKLRQTKAKILGYENHARYKTEVRMAKHEKNVYKMTMDLLKGLTKKVKLDFDKLRIEAAENNIKDLASYDDPFLSNKIKEREYSLDDQMVREYFELNSVMDFMFSHFGKLFGFTVKETDIKLWHKDVKLFALSDSKSKKVISYLAVDLYPRDGKYGHACMMPIVEGMQIDKNTYRAPLAALICNFPKPNKKVPSLLTIGEIETLFHEFGHGLHGMLTEAKYTTHAGTNVVWDFVEMPSQIMEQWVMEESILKKLGKHYKTGDVIPKDLINKIIKAKNFRSAVFYTRQCVQGLLDIDLYTGVATDPVKHFHDLMKKYLLPLDKKVLFVSRFSHIVGGYDAGYYSYLWAERLAKDVYSIFKKEGLTNSQLGAKYREEILSRGGSREEIDSVKAFLGRAPNNIAFVESLE